MALATYPMDQIRVDSDAVTALQDSPLAPPVEGQSRQSKRLAKYPRTEIAGCTYRAISRCNSGPYLARYVSPLNDPSHGFTARLATTSAHPRDTMCGKLRRIRATLAVRFLLFLFCCRSELPVLAEQGLSLSLTTSTGLDVKSASDASWYAEQARVVCVDAVPLNSKLSEPTDVVWKVPIGSLVEPGQVVAQLDTTSIHNRVRKAELALAKAQTEREQTEERTKIVQLEQERAIASAETELKMAKLDQEIYLQGELKQTERALKRTLTLAEKRFQHAQTRLNGSRLSLNPGDEDRPTSPCACPSRKGFCTASMGSV